MAKLIAPFSQPKSQNETKTKLSLTMVWKAYHPFQDIIKNNILRTKKATMISKVEEFELCQEFLVQKAAEDNCTLLKKKTPLKCNCLKILQDKDDAINGVAIYMRLFPHKTRDERTQIVIDWCRYAQDEEKTNKQNFSPTRKCYHIPFNADDDDEWSIDIAKHKICKLAHDEDNRNGCRSPTRNPQHQESRAF